MDRTGRVIAFAHAMHLNVAIYAIITFLYMVG